MGQESTDTGVIGVCVGEWRKGWGETWGARVLPLVLWAECRGYRTQAGE